MNNPPYSSVSASIGINDATGGSGHFLVLIGRREVPFVPGNRGDHHGHRTR